MKSTSPGWCPKPEKELDKEKQDRAHALASQSRDRLYHRGEALCQEEKEKSRFAAPGTLD